MQDAASKTSYARRRKEDVEVRRAHAAIAVDVGGRRLAIVADDIAIRIDPARGRNHGRSRARRVDRINANRACPVQQRTRLQQSQPRANSRRAVAIDGPRLVAHHEERSVRKREQVAKPRLTGRHRHAAPAHVPLSPLGGTMGTPIGANRNCSASGPTNEGMRGSYRDRPAIPARSPSASDTGCDRAISP